MSRTNLLHEAELALLNAPFESDGWLRAIDMMAQATGGGGANLVGFGGPLALPLNLYTGKEEALAQQYFAKPELWGSCNWRVNSSSSPQTVQHEAHYAAYRETTNTADYDDAVADLDMQFGCQSVLISDDRTFVGLAIHRGRKQGPSDCAALSAFRQLLRPAQRALRLQLALAGEAAEIMLGEFSRLHPAVVLIDRQGCISALSPAAEDLFGEGGPARMGGLTFEFHDRAENRRMQAALARLLADALIGEPSWVHEMHLTSEGRPRWIARAFRLPHRDHGLGFHPQVAIAFEPMDQTK